MSRISSFRDLFPSERRFLSAMDELQYCRVESARIVNGEMVLDPWPTTVRGVKFGTENRAKARSTAAEFELKEPV